MASQRIPFLPLLAILLISSPSWAAAPEIVLPDPPAVELPAGAETIGADDPSLKELISRARLDPNIAGMHITAALPRDHVGVGLWRVIWSAWNDETPDLPAARREGYVYVLPHRMIPVGSSGKTDASAGNNAVHIARDADGFVHMVWTDAWRPGAHEGAVYRRAQVLPDGTMRLDTERSPLAPHLGSWTAFPALTVVGNTVHFAWQADGTVWYRSLTRVDGAWRWSDEVNTKVPGPGRDTGPVIVADAQAVHILAPGGVYTTSTDHGRTWFTEPVPFPPNHGAKTASLTLDREGRPLVAASLFVIDPPVELSDDKGHGAYWTLALTRRVGPRAWEAIPSPVADRPEWAAPAQPDEDVLCDWVRILEDHSGGIHVSWHGTAVSRIYARDRAYYAWRAPNGVWRAPVALREPDPDRGISWSYAPALALDGDRALALLFYDTLTGKWDRGYDSELRLFKDGRSLAPALPVTRFGETSIVTGEPEVALSAWFPGMPDVVYHGVGGTTSTDVLVTLVPVTVTAPGLVVWERLDLTDWLKNADQ